MFKFLVMLILFFLGCVINPKYSDLKAISEEQAQKYPLDADQIRRQQRDYEKQKNIQNAQPSPKNSYIVVEEKISGWSVGNPDAGFHLGKNKYKYYHKINLNFVCEKNSFSPKPFRYKNIKWRISDSILGEMQTSGSGQVSIGIPAETRERFRKITVTTANSTHDLGLDGYLLVSLEQSECH